MYVTREFRFQGERLLVRSTVLHCNSTGTGCDIARDAASRPLKELQGGKKAFHDLVLPRPFLYACTAIRASNYTSLFSF